MTYLKNLKVIEFQLLDNFQVFLGLFSFTRKWLLPHSLLNRKVRFLASKTQTFLFNNNSYRSSLKYALPRPFGGAFSFDSLAVPITRTTIVTIYGSIPIIS